MLLRQLATSVAVGAVLIASPAFAASDADIALLKQELAAMRQSYEGRIAELETKLNRVEAQQAAKPLPATPAAAMAPPPPPNASTAPLAMASGRSIYDNSFNPSIGVILDGRYNHFSAKDGSIAGFGTGEEGERGKEGLGLAESELNFSANIDDKFFGNVTAAIASENGSDAIELEEAYVKTLPGIGLPTGMSIKAGRALWSLGYLNELHAHADDFADRPLPYRAFLNGAFNDDGLEVSYVLPTELYMEVGGGAFRGDDYPYGQASGGGVGAFSAFARVGGDIGDDQNWRVGASMLTGNTNGREGNGGGTSFAGDSTLFIADARYTWAPTGNPFQQEVLLQGEYFWRKEQGSYEDFNLGTGPVGFDGHASGWYAQGVYKFLPQWRIGARYSRLTPADVPAGLTGSALDSDGHDPVAYAVMGDWSHSEFSRVRLQYSREDVNAGPADNQITLQYIMSLGAHAAHQY